MFRYGHLPTLAAIVARRTVDAFKPRAPPSFISSTHWSQYSCYSDDVHGVKRKYRVSRMAGNFGADKVPECDKFGGELTELLDALVPALQDAVEEMTNILSSHVRNDPHDVEAIAVVEKAIPFFEKRIKQCHEDSGKRKFCFANIPTRKINALYACLSLGNLAGVQPQSLKTPKIVKFFVLLKMFYEHNKVFGTWSNVGQIKVLQARKRCNKLPNRVCDMTVDESLAACRKDDGEELEICRPCTDAAPLRRSACKELLFAFPACNHAKPAQCACNGEGHSAVFPAVLAAVMCEGSPGAKDKIRATVLGYYDESGSANVQTYTRDQVMSVLDVVLSEESGGMVETMRQFVLLLCNMGLLAAGTMRVQLKASEEGNAFLEELYYCDICCGPCFLSIYNFNCPGEVKQAINNTFDPKLENIFSNMMQQFVRLQAGATIEKNIVYSVHGAFYMNTSTIKENEHGQEDRVTTRTTVHSDIWKLSTRQHAVQTLEILPTEDWKRWETGFRDRFPGLLHGVANPARSL
jgi:hypothetical protein